MCKIFLATTSLLKNKCIIRECPVHLGQGCIIKERIVIRKEVLVYKLEQIFKKSINILKFQV